MGYYIRWIIAARCQLFKFDSISALSISIFDIIGLSRTSQEYHQRFLRTDKNYNFSIHFIKISSNILKIEPIFGDFVIRYRFLMLFDAGLSIVLNWFWVHNRCRFDILKNRSEEHTSELQSRETISYAVFCLKKKNKHHLKHTNEHIPIHKANKLYINTTHNITEAHTYTYTIDVK